jgi:pimeloyl-ACP methyl ester carboxylesterase
MTGAAGLRSALLLHGAGGGGWEWNVWRGVLEAGGLQVVAPDLRPAPAGVAATRLKDYLAQAAAELDRLPPPCVLIGASLGGLLAAQLARHAAALVLVNPVPAAPWHGALRARERPAVVPWRRQARLESTRAALPGADTATALFAFRRWRDESGAALREAHAGIHVARPACPVLCIASLCDDDVPAAATEAWAQAWQADLMRLDRSSHVDPLLGAEAAPLASRVLAWLSAR